MASAISSNVLSIRVGDDDPQHVERVRRAIELEHSMSRREAVQRYPWAIFWSFAMTLTIVMEGYDTALLGSFFAYPSFVEQYGTYEPSIGAKSIPASWMVGLENAVSCGELVGLALSGWAMERFGHRKVMIASLVPLCGFVAVQFFSKTLNMLLAGILLVSIPWGVFTVLGTAYSSEICPATLRAYLTSFTSVAWVIGQLIAAGILSGLVNYSGHWSYRIPFAIQWVWPIPLAVLAWLAPESPWWYIRRGRHEDAHNSMRRLARHESEEELLDRLAMMKHTNNHELAMKTQSSYFDCFKGTNLTRTEIVCMLYISQGWCGERFAYNATYYFTQAGLSDDAAYKLNLGSTAISFICIFVTWVLFKYVGRRTIIVTGLAGLSICLLLMGTLAFSSSPAAIWTAGAFALVWISIYSLSIGPVVYTIAGEVSATRLRNHTFAVGRTAYVIINIIDKVIEPYLINPTEGNLKGKTALFWLGTNTIVLLWAIFRLPETKGRTFQEMDVLFERKIPARHFKRTKVETVGEVDPVEHDDEKAPQDIQVDVKV